MALGWKREHIEIHEDPETLIGYDGRARAINGNICKAHVIIRRHNVGHASNDLGFLLEDGIYTPIISEYDLRVGQARAGQGLGKQFMLQLMGQYAIAECQANFSEEFEVHDLSQSLDGTMRFTLKSKQQQEATI